MAERRSLAAEIAAMREGAYVPHPWLVYLDEPTCGMWARGLDECDLAGAIERAEQIADELAASVEVGE